MSIHAAQNRLHRAASRMRARYWRLLHPGIEVGRGVRIGRGCRLFLDPSAHLILRDRATVDDYTTLAVYGAGRIELGERSFVGHHSTLAARELVSIGPGAFLAELVSIRDHDHAVGEPPSSGRVEVAPVVVHADAWLGSKVTILRGATVGEMTVVGANSVVRGDLPPRTVCVGAPARVVRTQGAQTQSSGVPTAADAL